MVTPDRRRRAVVVLQGRFGVSQRRACRVVGQHRSTQRRPLRAMPAADVKLLSEPGPPTSQSSPGPPSAVSSPDPPISLSAPSSPWGVSLSRLPFNPSAPHHPGRGRRRGGPPAHCASGLQSGCRRNGFPGLSPHSPACRSPSWRRPTRCPPPGRWSPQQVRSAGRRGGRAGGVVAWNAQQQESSLESTLSQFR